MSVGSDVRIDAPNRRPQVDPATVGQFTGFNDKNGERIFEGDIVRFLRDPNYLYFVQFSEGAFVAVCSNGFAKTERDDVPQIMAYWWGDNGSGVPEVVGNIYDNPKFYERDYGDDEEDLE
ncbi:MAG: YopX family protein [Oscillospiraceae bacterium]|nr:YopX family protein [Oscillospiraceae bacterium]